MFDRVEVFVSDAARAGNRDDLSGLLGEVATDLGFDCFALTQHADPGQLEHSLIRIDNYPAAWVEYFNEQRMGATDPVHRASNRTSIGFAWSDLSRLVQLTGRDRQVLELARDQGLGNGFTVPAHIPGEINGSCSFATSRESGFPVERLREAQLVGAFAFEAARSISSPAAAASQPRLTDRQRDCLVWVARGKSDWEISRILGVSQETVILHLKHARERYGVAKRTELTVRALFDGTISFNDILR